MVEEFEDQVSFRVFQLAEEAKYEEEAETKDMQVQIIRECQPLTCLLASFHVQLDRPL
jgi:hypothetical protein